MHFLFLYGKILFASRKTILKQRHQKPLQIGYKYFKWKLLFATKASFIPHFHSQSIESPNFYPSNPLISIDL